jgi:hypothetical protein
VPGIYAKLLDVDKVDLIVGPYATAQIAPAMPIVISKNKVFVTLLGLGVNSEFKYPNYFAMIPTGPDRSGLLPRTTWILRWRRRRGRKRSQSWRLIRNSLAMLPTGPETTSRR